MIIIINMTGCIFDVRAPSTDMCSLESGEGHVTSAHYQSVKSLSDKLAALTSEAGHGLPDH